MSQKAFVKNILPLFEETREEFLDRAREAAIQIASKDESGLCTIDMVRAECPPPEGMDPRVMGAVFKCHGPKARWEKVGYTSSRRKTCHGRPVAIFRLKAVTDRERTHTLLAESVGRLI